MRNRKEFAETMIAIAAMFEKVLSEAVIDIYWQSFREYDDSVVKEALMRGVKTVWKFFPKPAEVVELIEGSPQAKQTMAWMLLVEGIKKAGAKESVRFQDPIIHTIVELWGGWTQVCYEYDLDARDFKFKEKDFKTLYQYFLSRCEKHPEYLPGGAEKHNKKYSFLDAIKPPLEIGFSDGTIMITRKPEITDGRGGDNQQNVIDQASREESIELAGG